MRQCGNFSPLAPPAPSPYAWATHDMSARLLRDSKALPSIAQEIAQMRQAGAFDGLAAVLRENAVAPADGDDEEVEISTVSDPSDGMEVSEATGSPELLALIRQAMAKQGLRQRPSPSAQNSSGDNTDMVFGPSDSEADDSTEEDEDDAEEDATDEGDTEEGDDDEDEDDDEDDDEDSGDDEEDGSSDEDADDQRAPPARPPVPKLRGIELEAFFPSSSDEEYVVERPEVQKGRATMAPPGGAQDLIRALVKRQELSDVADIDAAVLQRALLNRAPTFAKADSPYFG